MNIKLILYSSLSLLFAEISQLNQIVVGIICGLLLNMLTSTSVELHDIGILLTMVIIGGHMNFALLYKFQRLIFVILCTTGVMVFITIFILQSIFSSLSILQLCILATCLCLSSTLICQQILEKNKANNTHYGKITILSTVVQDIIGIIVLSVLHLNITELKITIFALCIFLFLVIGFVYIKNNVPYDKWHLIRYLSTQSIYNIKITLFGLFLLIGHFTYIPNEVVYFITGACMKNLIAESKYEITYLQTISMIMLFMFVGNSIDMYIIQKYVFIILELFVVTTALKLFLLYVMLSIVTNKYETNMRSTILLSTCSELTFFVVTILDVDNKVKNIIYATTFLSMLFTIILFNLVSKILDQIQQRNIGIAKYAARMNIAHLNKYVLIVGINEITSKIIYVAGQVFIDIVAIDNKLDKVLEHIQNCYFMDALNNETYNIIKLNKLYCIVIVVRILHMQVQIIEKIVSLSKNVVMYVLTNKRDINEVKKHKNVVPILTDHSCDGDVENIIIDYIKDHIAQ